MRAAACRLPLPVPAATRAAAAPGHPVQDTGLLTNFHVTVFSAQPYVLDYLEEPLRAAVDGNNLRVRRRRRQLAHALPGSAHF